jgi:uncharacterized surface protein with fasciclin (FAS1) repeats
MSDNLSDALSDRHPTSFLGIEMQSSRTSTTFEFFSATHTTVTQMKHQLRRDLQQQDVMLIHVRRFCKASPNEMADIVDTAIKAGSFNTLVTAVKAAGSVDTLKGASPFTVFAPSDEAFSKLPAGTVDGLLKDIPKLKKILTYHVAFGKVMAADAVKLKSAKTVEGSEVKIDASKGVKINSSIVTTPDVAADNGVIYIINTVLMLT